ncbi:uncharacterized protein [Temnothorax longispinosus]|uniref:uncharacterized protein isoform X2 n=1 Tax=Temnothorax longispinosus TaxID=300112 RepID=UPI003A991F17
MSFSNFGHGRGFRPPRAARGTRGVRGARAARRFGRPRFPRPPFRHAGPPRPGHPAQFGVPWQPNNMFFQSHPLRGAPPFRSGSDGRRRFCTFDVRFPTPNILPVPLDYDEDIDLASCSLQAETDQDGTAPQLPLLGSEEERQQKITETADRLKQKLFSFSSKTTDVWSEDVPIDLAEDDCIENRIPVVVGYKSSELKLTYNDLKDIGKINPDNANLDNAQHATDVFNITNNTNNDVILDENENGSHLMIPSDQMTNLENVPDDNACMETDNWEFQEQIYNSNILEQSNLHGDNNIELLQSDIQYQYDVPPAIILQDQDDQQQDTLQEIREYPTNATEIGEYPMDATEIREYPTDATEIGEYPPDATEIREYPMDAAEIREYPTDATEIGEYPTDATEIVEYPTDATKIGEYPTDATEIGEYPTDATEIREYPTDATGIGEYPTDATEIGKYPTDATEIREYPTDATEIGEYPTDATEIGKYPTDATEIREYPMDATEIGEYPTDATKEQEESETLNLPTVSFPIDSVDQNILLKENEERPQNEELLTNFEVQENVLNSHVHAENSNGSNSALIQPALADVSANNVALDNQLPKVQENSFHSPPNLSPHTEQVLPVDFDPTTPPPILLKQDQPPRILPPYSIPPDLPPLFDPTAPPPNIKCLLGSTIPHEDANPAWSNAQNPMPAAYTNIDVHTGLNTHGGFMLQQLPLEMSNQNNVFLPPHVDSVNFSPIFPMPLNSQSGINTHVPPILPQMHATPLTYVSPSSLPELSSSPDLSYSVNKDDVLDDMQEAMKFAKEMTNITGKTDESSKSSSKSSVSVNPVGDVESIALPPGKPRAKTSKKKIKEDNTCSKKKIVPEEQSTADHLSSEETIQDANAKSKDVELMMEQDRPKVVFNLNNKTKMINTKTARQENIEKRNGMTHSVESEKTRAVPSVTKKNTLRRRESKESKEGEKNLKRNENNSKSTILFESIANQAATLPHKKPQKDIHTEKSQSSNVSLYSKINAQKSRSCIEKNENSNMETSWKNKIISRFLKMSTNDIYNMVNNTSLRKFNIIMKRLVKEKKSTLSLEMRQAEDEKMKMYDQQEFMKQLNAMLDTDAIVSVTDLPTEFIHHLNEVLQLDVQPDNHAESATASSSQCHSENTNYVFSSVTHATECANKTTTSNDVSQECVRNKGHTTKMSYNKDVHTRSDEKALMTACVQVHNVKSNDLNLKDDICNTIVDNDPISSNLLTLQHDLDDIFSEVTKKNQIPAAVKERKRFSMAQQNAKKFDVGAMERSVEREALLEDDTAYRLENCPRWDEKCDRWKRKEQEDPHAYRNLTKEEWEARYGTTESGTMLLETRDTLLEMRDTLLETRDTLLETQMNPTPSFCTKKIAVNNKKLSSRGNLRGREFYPRRRYSSESSKHPSNTRHRSLEKDKHKKSRRHSDDRGHSTGYLEHIINTNSNSSNSSSSSSTSSNSSSSTDNANVAKLLRVIKENEKVAKKMSLNEAIRDEVNAEIERERKSRKSRKNRKSRKRRKARMRRKRQNKKMTSSSDSSSEKDDEEADDADKLLTESEIKKEIVENQITQEVIVKEELDIGQEAIIENAEFASASSLVMENKAAYLLSASQNKLESPLAHEIPLAIVNPTQLYAEDRLPTASPTQPKTKAQLKQMPETSDMNDNKVPLNVFTCIPEDWSTVALANFSECTEDLNRACRTADVDCNQDKIVLSTEGASKSARLQLNETPCTLAELSTKIKDANEISASDNDVSRVSTVATSASSVSGVSSVSTVTQKQGASKKIDIKTYYERAKERRMNEKSEPKRPAENPAISTRKNSLTPKATEPEVAVNKSTFISTYSGPILDPRLVSRLAVPCVTNNKDDTAQSTSGKNSRQREKPMTKESTIAELAPRRPEEKNSNHIVDGDSGVKKINQNKSKAKVSPAASNIKVISNVVVTSKIITPRSRKLAEIRESVADKQSQSKVSSDSKRFKNIRSEGSKELKLKKELAMEQKAKKKSAAASKSVGLVSTKVHFPLEKTTRAEEVAQEKKIDNTGNINKIKTERIQSIDSRESKVNDSNIKTERIQSIDSRESKVNDSNIKTEPSTISSGNTDNNADELPRDIKPKERSSNFNVVKRENAEKTVSNIDVDTRKHSSKTTRDKETRYVKRAKNIASTEIANKKDRSARKICNAVPELDVSTASKIALEVPENKTSIVKINKKDSSTSKIQEADAAKDMELSFNYADQSQIKKSNDRDLSESTINRDTSGISKLEAMSRSDSIDKEDRRSKEDQLLINIKTNDSKEDNMEFNIPDTYKSASATEDKSRVKKIAGPSASNKNFQEQQGTTSLDSVGSPFKGFLQETMIDFEQPNIFNQLDEVNANKDKILLDDCNVNYATRIAGCKGVKIEGRQDYETLETDKECTTSEKRDKSDLAATDESGEGRVRKSSSEIVTAALRDEDNDIDEGGETDRPLMSKDGYASCAGLVIKESMFINEEEIIQGEARTKDLASKLKTTTDPSLSDALETTISDDALRLPDSHGVDHLDNHIYLEANISAEKAPCDKLPGFDSDEHLDNDMFLDLDDRLQGTATFDNKDDECVHFPVQEESPPYNITPAVTPETTMITQITPCADLSKPEDCKLDLKHIPSSDNDSLAEASAEQSPTDTSRTLKLNIRTKAALKEATNFILKSPNNVPTENKEVTIEIDKTQQMSEACLNYQTSAWNIDGQNNIKTHALETPNDTTAQDFVNVNTISSTQNGSCDQSVYKDIDVNHDGRSVTSPSGNIEKRLHSGMLRNPVVELRKMKELDKLLEKRRQQNSEKINERAYESQRKHNGTILHKLKDKRQMKCRSKETSNKTSLVKRLKKMRQSGRIAATTREAILARMLEIDLEMRKLSNEKLKLHEILRNDVLPTEDSVTNSSVILRTREDDTVAGQPQVPSTLISQNSEISHTKQIKNAPSSRSSLKERKRISSRNSEDDELSSYTPVHQKTKMPVIRWKKKPRLEQTIRREEEGREDEEKEEEDLDEMTEQQTSTSVSRKVEDSTVDAVLSEDIIQKPESNDAVDHEAREEKITGKSDKEESACDIDLKRAICSDKSTADKNADDRSDLQDLAKGETERAKYFDIDKRNVISPPDEAAKAEAAKANSQPPSKQVHSTPERLSIYSDDSTWNSLVQNTASEIHENRKATGLVLLDETLKKEQARSRKMRAEVRKMKAEVRKKKKQQLDNFLRTVNNLTMEEEELPLSKLYIRKLRQKRDLIDSLSQKKEDTDLVVDPNILKSMDEMINAVVENKESLYEPQLEAPASEDIPATSNVSPVLQSDNQFYVEAEANANSDWPCREKENVEEVALRQDSNDVPGADGSNHVFKAVSQDKIPFHDERNRMEPDSSITPEETLIENHSLDCERDRSKDSNNITSRSFDIKVSVPKILIKDDFSLELSQKFKDTEGAVVGTGLVDSTTNILSANPERLEEKDKSSRDSSQAVKSIVEENKKDEKGETKDKPAVDADEREETVDSVSNAPQSVPQLSNAKSGYSDISENEESGDSVASNRNNKIATRDTHDSSVSESTGEKTDTKQKKSDAESEQLSNDAIALKQDCQSMENTAAEEEEKSNPENKSRAFEKILDHDQSNGSSILIDLTSERSEESNDTSIEQKSSLEHTSTSTISFDKATAKSGEPSKKLRRKHDNSAPVRRSARNSSETVRSSRVKEVDADSNSSERDSSVLHETNFTTRSRSKSPTWAMPDEKVTSNGRKNRVARKVQNVIRRKVISRKAKSKKEIVSLAKHSDMITESTASNNSTVANAKKRKQHTEEQIKNCKVRLIDCKPALLKYVKPEVLDRLGIIAVNPCAPSDTSSTQHTTSNQNTVISIAASSKSFFFPEKPCDKATPEVELLEEKPIKESSDKDLTQESVSQAPEIDGEESAKMQYTVHKGPILDIKVFKNSFLAASEDSKIYRYSQTSNEILNIYKGHKSAVTCLYICKSDITGVNKELMYSGSLDGTLRCYDISSGELIKNPAQINSPIQCMDQAWGIIFIGTKSGHVSRFQIKTSATKGSTISFSDKSVLALKATNEGPRKILIVASRNQPIAIRDALNGLFLRTISGQKNHTVYSLLRHNNLIYCGTSSRSINVFDFTTGEQAIQYDAGVGIVCMRLYKHLLFAGCYDGNIYVFNINNHKLVCSIHGPGNMLLSIEVVNNKIIAGSKDKRLHSWEMPTQVRALL